MSRPHHNHRYTPEDILAEANMFLTGCTLSQVSINLNIPLSTVSWHLIYPLKDLDHVLWICVRSKLDKYAKNKSRIIHVHDHYNYHNHEEE